MIPGAGFLGRPLTGALLLLALGGAWTAAPVLGAEIEPDADLGNAAVSADPTSPVLQSPCLRRDFVPPYLPAAHLNLAYSHPLITEITYDARTLGPNGCLDLPGNRRLRAGLEFSLILQGEVRRLAPDAAGATLTVTVHPGWISEDWTWPDGLILQRVYFQPLAAEALGVRCVLKNKTNRALSGVRLAVQLANPDMSALNARTRPRTGFTDLLADPRSETLILRDVQTYEEGFIAFGWGPQGGFMGSGGTGDETPLWPGKMDAPNPAQVTVSMETPAWDIFPNQTREAFFWITWGLESESVRNVLESLRSKSGYEAWEKKAGLAAVHGVLFECHDPYISYLFSSAKAWAVWMKRSDEFGNQYLYSPGGTEPVRPGVLANGALGWEALGRPQALKQHLENWLDQKYEPADTACLVLAMHTYFLWTHDRSWLAENAARLEDMLNALVDMDINGDGLPEQAHSETALGVLAFRQGAELMGVLGRENLPAAAKFRAMADLGEQTLKSGSRKLKVRTRTAKVDYQGEQSAGQGRPDPAKTLELLRLGLNDPKQATAAAKAFIDFSHGQAGDPGLLGGLSSQPGQSVQVDFDSLKLIELFLQGLAGLDFSLEGLRVHVPPYTQDLGIRLRNLEYAGALLQVEVKGTGAHGRIFVNNRAWDSSRPIPRTFFAQGKVRIVIEKTSR